MTLPTGPERDYEHARLLLQEYSFDLQGFKAGELVAIWQERLDAEPTWIRAAVLEALYLGRYKAFSVEQILRSWKRRGHPVRHFNSEFERVVFGPIDPTASKYALMTTQSPSELMLPQSETWSAESSTGEGEAIALPPTAASVSPENSVEQPTTSTEPAVEATTPQPTTESQQLELPTTAIAPTSPPPPADLPSEPAAEMAPQSAASMFSQPAPIQKFTPQPSPSEFYERLQAVARHAE